jgi:hypothetical protein
MELEDKISKLKPILGDRKTKSLWTEYSIYPEHRREIEGIINALYEKHIQGKVQAGEVFLLPPREDQVKGEYCLGMVQYGDKPFFPFCLREEDWIQHVGIFGRTGSGKTNVGFLIIDSLNEHGKPFLIFDWKRNYRDLLDQSKIKIFTVGRDVAPFFFNPLIPPKGTLTSVWMKKLIEIMCHAYYLGEGVSYLLQKAIDATYQERKSNDTPTLLDVKRWLENYKAKGREAQWMDSTIRVIGTLCYGEISRVLNARYAMPIESLLNENVIFELDALTNSDKIFFIESLILWIHHFRLQEETREKFKHAIVIEEAHHVLLKKKQSKESVMDVLLREIRELGESIIILDQHPSLISIPSLGNTNCTIAMNLKHRMDVNGISSAMLLDEKDQECIGMLDVGYGIVRLQNRASKPFLVKFSKVLIQKGAMTDEKVKSLMMSNSAYSEDLLPIRNQMEDVRPIRNEDKPKTDNEITEDQRRLLMDILEYPISGVAERYKRLFFSVHKGNKIRDELIEFGFLRSTQISTFEGRVIYLEPTSKALANIGVERKREGGPEHEYWKYRIAEWLKSTGYETEIESPIGEGKTVDIVAQKAEKRIAIEIETGKSDIGENIRKCCLEGFSEIWIVCLNIEARKSCLIVSKLLDIKEKVKIWALFPRDIFKERIVDRPWPK